MTPRPADLAAAEAMARLHDRLHAAGLRGRALALWLVRALYCMFAEATGVLPPRRFTALVEAGAGDLAARLAALHAALAPDHGELFAEALPIAAFDPEMRRRLLDCCALDWRRISPAIFGSLFQSVMDPQARRHLGAHYTSEQNILKAIRPLFLDDLRRRFESIRESRRAVKQRLAEFQRHLAALRFLDPACGCGNFLVVAYRELRLLELELLKEMSRDTTNRLLDISGFSQVNVDQCFGIETEEFPARIAQVALWMTDHQMNMRLSQEFGQFFSRLPRVTAPHIRHGNALRLDWRALVPPSPEVYILGNPPFVGHQWRSAAQVADMDLIWGPEGRFGRLDYVACWYRKAIDYMAGTPALRAAFVSTNSITQGEQVGILWPELLRRGARIHFAHRTFQWTSEARGKAAVHCVIVGFGAGDVADKQLFDDESPRADPQVARVTHINPYLVAAPDVFLPSRSSPWPGVPPIRKGSQPTDGGHLILTQAERDALVAAEKGAKKWLRPYVGGEELIHGEHRWCLWLVGIRPDELRALPQVRRRVAAVREARRSSPTASVRAFADRPTLFTQDRQPRAAYLAVPEVSSEARRFIPIAFLPATTIGSNKLQIVADGAHYHLGVLSSTMHMAWVRAVAGRLKSDYSYSPAVYNNFPWPAPTPRQAAAIDAAAREVLAARAAHPGATLATLYDPSTTPPDLARAHARLDRAVDAAYARPRGLRGDADRVAFLFERYVELAATRDAPARRSAGP
jgi:hypothetical protein